MCAFGLCVPSGSTFLKAVFVLFVAVVLFQVYGGSCAGLVVPVSSADSGCRLYCDSI
jgi:hypothetical protein